MIPRRLATSARSFTSIKYPSVTGLQKRQLQNVATHQATGLFSLSSIQNPSDFLQISKEAIHTSDDLRTSLPTEITSKAQAVDVLYQLDQISKTVCNVIDAAELCRSAHASATWRDAANAAFMKLQDYIGTLNGDKNLYDNLAYIHSNYYDQLTSEEQRFCLLLKQEFEIDGIHLPEEERKNVKEVHNRIANLESLFATNITHSDKRFKVDLKTVEQIIPRDVLLANGATFDPNAPDKIEIPANSPISNSITSFGDAATLRKEVYMASVNSCTDNIDVLESLIDARQVLAHALGYNSYSQRFLQDKMAQSPENVDQFLQGLQQQIAPGHKKEMELISRTK